MSGYLALENGTVFEGEIFGYKGETHGEVVFNTSLCGYQEILTDPSYYGQIVVMTYPLIGNYGVNEQDVESGRVQVKGFVVGCYEDEWSNFQGKESLEEYLVENKITGITGVDTRALTKIVRGEGAMRGLITSNKLKKDELIKKVKENPSMSGLDLVKKVTRKDSYLIPNKHADYRIAVYDYGIKQNILREFQKFNVELEVFGAHTSAEEIIEKNPDGIFLSNGPGDPSAVTYAVDSIKKIIPSNIPTFGICLGHQLIALALDAKTYKLKFGHRGANHPVKNKLTNKIEITSQNHGFAVDESSLNTDLVEVSHTNLYDGTNEGLQHKKYPVMSVQYHPEAAPGPHDSKYLFDDFMKLVHKHKK